MPNGDIAIIGNILKDSNDKIEKNYRNKKRALISKQSEQKINIFIANENEETINKVINEISILKYVEVIGTVTNGKEALEKILQTKLDIAFLQYDFENLLGYNIILELAQKLQLEAPSFNIFFNIFLDNELKQFIKNKYIKLNGWISDNVDKEEILDIVKIYKSYRDKE